MEKMYARRMSWQGTVPRFTHLCILEGQFILHGETFCLLSVSWFYQATPITDGSNFRLKLCLL